MKIALLSDSHFGVFNSNSSHAKILQSFMQHFFEVLRANQIQTIFHLGDIVDNRNVISFQTIANLKRDWINPIDQQNLMAHVILGNHDVSKRNTNDLNCSSLFDSSDNIQTYDSVTPVTLPDGTEILLVPWINKENEAETLQAISESKADYLFGHFEIMGSKMLREVVSHHGYSPDLFAQFKQVFTGHFHHRNAIKNIQYIGSNCQLNWGDYGDWRGFLILDTLTGEVTEIENPYSPFFKFFYDDVKHKYEDFQFLSKYQLADKIVRVVMVNKTNPYKLEQFTQAVSDLKPASVSIVESDVALEMDEVLTDDEIEELKADTLSLINISVDSIVDSHQRTPVKHLMAEIYTEALNRS